MKMNHQDILQIIPHRYPFLFIDGVLECDEKSFIIGYKNVTLNEPYVYLDSRENPRLPESLIVECMAQVGAVAILSRPENQSRIMLFAAVEDLQFHSPVYPGAQLISHVQPVFLKGTLGKMKGVAYVLNQIVAEGFFTYALTDRVSKPASL